VLIGNEQGLSKHLSCQHKHRKTAPLGSRSPAQEKGPAERQGQVMGWKLPRMGEANTWCWAGGKRFDRLIKVNAPTMAVYSVSKLGPEPSGRHGDLAPIGSSLLTHRSPVGASFLAQQSLQNTCLGVTLRERL